MQDPSEYPVEEVLLGTMSGNEWAVGFIVWFVGFTVSILAWYYLLVRPQIDEVFEDRRELAELNKEN
ncbi:hypothetical protein [Halorussus aquaticus]|uniref:Uncharacterized protein n=1 Tax=Halorussus aquaticus TaxID=2953748 RepID=A0ABD5Q3B7_9EURY|nr:hypothetical protein [Halorussus aquaticus]